MEVKVDSNRIRTERECRGWSQEHLAGVAGLSLRTVQRIEKTGAASFESVTALAAVFAVDVATLRASEALPARQRALRVSLDLPLRLALAAVSGLLCALHFRWRFYEGLGIGFEWFDYVAAGALFGGAVLCPYLRPGPGLVKRVLGLVGASALSYFCAVFSAVQLTGDAGMGMGRLAAFVLASGVGVTLVLAAAKFLIPLRVTAAYWLLGAVASLVGGAAMFAGLEYLPDTRWNNIAGFCAWHMLTCVAIHRGHQPDDAQGGVLAEFAKARGRFSIVPGWLKVRLPALA